MTEPQEPDSQDEARHAAGTLAVRPDAAHAAPKRRRAIGDRLFVNEEWRKTVCFLGRPGSVPRGTGFLVGMEVAVGVNAYYLVTALHVARKRHYGDPLVMIARGADGRSTSLKIPDEAWTEHPTTDVAVAEMHEIDDSAIEGAAIDFGVLADDDYLEKSESGCGQDVFALGLFYPHAGTIGILPVARFGHISLMPKERIEVTLDADSSPPTKASVDAYLVEMHSWGGVSGSPVFTYTQRGGGHLKAMQYHKLLGLVSAHWDIPSPVKVGVKNRRPRKANDDDRESVDVNSGFAVVIPASKIRDVLMQPELVETRARMAEKRRESLPQTTPDFAEPEKRGKKRGRPRTTPKPPGPEASRLKLEGNWKDRMADSLKVERPAGGWPKRPTKSQKKRGR